MTKEEMTIHWMDIVRCVFTAEDNISAIWKPALKKAKKRGDKDEIARVADAYVRAVAEECLKYEKFEE